MSLGENHIREYEGENVGDCNHTKSQRPQWWPKPLFFLFFFVGPVLLTAARPSGCVDWLLVEQAGHLGRTRPHCRQVPTTASGLSHTAWRENEMAGWFEQVAREKGPVCTIMR